MYTYATNAKRRKALAHPRRPLLARVPVRPIFFIRGIVLGLPSLPDLGSWCGATNGVRSARILCHHADEIPHGLSNHCVGPNIDVLFADVVAQIVYRSGSVFMWRLPQHEEKNTWRARLSSGLAGESCKKRTNVDKLHRCQPLADFREPVPQLVLRCDVIEFG
jgi:hypothetical protein